MRLFRVKNGKIGSKKGSRDASRSIKRVIILNNQYKYGFKVESDHFSVLLKCKKDLENLKEKVIDFSKNLEIV